MKTLLLVLDVCATLFDSCFVMGLLVLAAWWGYHGEYSLFLGAMIAHSLYCIEVRMRPKTKP